MNLKPILARSHNSLKIVGRVLRNFKKVRTYFQLKAEIREHRHMLSRITHLDSYHRRRARLDAARDKLAELWAA